MYQDFNAWPGPTLVQQLHKMAADFPDRPAVVDHNDQLSYAEFNRLSDMIAGQIAGLKPEKGTRIALFIEHGIMQFVGIFGIIKAGCAYVALDTAYPADRLLYILNDAGVSAIVSNTKNLAQAKELNSEIPVINAEVAGNQPGIQSISPDADDLCAIIYTSGSTGLPKGSWFTHRSLSHFAWRFSKLASIDQHDRVGYFVSISFSAHGMPMLGALMNGAALVLFNLKRESFSTFRNWLTSQKISVTLMIPSILRNFTATLNNSHHFPDLRVVMSGGESLFRADVEKLLPHLSEQAVVYHMLASTEAYLTCAFPIKKGDLLVSNSIPIGWDVEGVQTMVMDESGNPCEQGKIGELWIKSAFMAGGYWGESAQQNGAFGPAEGEPGLAVFRSSDMGYRQPDGALIMVGRKDNMVKLRGYRIDLREIESVLLELPETREVAVLPKENSMGSKHLVAYVVINEGHKFDEARIKIAVLRMLPDYMVPSFVVQLETLPKSYNGKIDFKQIPDPDWNAIEKEHEVVTPVSPTEIKLAEIISRILDVYPVGCDHSIIQLAKDSLKLFVALDEVEKSFGKKLNIDLILAAPTIKRIAAWLDEN